MRVVVVVESMFGNTYAIGEAIGEGLRATHPSMTSWVLRVADAHEELVSAADLLIVGAPTHWFGIPSQRTQRQYLRDTDLEMGRSRAGHPLDPSAAGLRVRNWLDQLPAASNGQRAAAFDTRLTRPFSGGAAPRIGHALTRQGYDLVGKPTGFIVTGMEGPLLAGEVERAREWAGSLLAPMLS